MQQLKSTLNALPQVKGTVLQLWKQQYDNLITALKGSMSLHIILKHPEKCVQYIHTRLKVWVHVCIHTYQISM